jgi:hypothetical protein
MPNPIKTFLLGTAARITTVISIPTAVSAVVSIYDSTGELKIDSADMTKEADGVYSYVYQSDEDDNDGEYTALIEVMYAGYTSVEEEKFTLNEQTN